MADALFDKLAQEKASGRLFTLRDWLATNPPRVSQTIAGIPDRVEAGTSFRNAVDL